MAFERRESKLALMPEILDLRGCDIVLMNGCGFLTSLLQTWTSTWNGPCLLTSWICRETWSGTWSECATCETSLGLIWTWICRSLSPDLLDLSRDLERDLERVRDLRDLLGL